MDEVGTLVTNFIDVNVLQKQLGTVKLPENQMMDGKRYLKFCGLVGLPDGCNKLKIGVTEIKGRDYKEVNGSLPTRCTEFDGCISIKIYKRSG